MIRVKLFKNIISFITFTLFCFLFILENDYFNIDPTSAAITIVKEFSVDKSFSITAKTSQASDTAQVLWFIKF